MQPSAHGSSGYRVFDTTLASNLPLDGLLPVSTDAPQFVCRIAPARELPTADAATKVHDWLINDDEDAVWLRVNRYAGGYWLHFPDLADFSISVDGTCISLWPGAETPHETLCHLLVDQVMPLVLAHCGRFVLHASAVMLPDGRGIAFAGTSGRGKSTLAAYFAGQGFPLLTDDGVLLDEREGRLWLTPSYAGVRLWEDSWATLFGEAVQLQQFAHYTQKKRVVVAAANGLDYALHAVPLARIYFLGSSAEMELPTTVEIAPVRPLTAFMELFKNSYRLDIHDRSQLRRTFARYTALSVRSLFYNLAYPHDLTALPSVKEAIVKHLCAD